MDFYDTSKWAWPVERCWPKGIGRRVVFAYRGPWLRCNKVPDYYLTY